MAQESSPPDFGLLSAGQENQYIYGLHDPGGEHLLDGKGWVVVTEAIGHDPNDRSGVNYSAIPNQGLGVIVRLNNGYGAAYALRYAIETANHLEAATASNNKTINALEGGGDSIDDSPT